MLYIQGIVGAAPIVRGLNATLISLRRLCVMFGISESSLCLPTNLNGTDQRPSKVMPHWKRVVTILWYDSIVHNYFYSSDDQNRQSYFTH